MEKLSVKPYDPKEAVAKKQRILKSTVATGCALVLMLSMFSLTGCRDNENNDDDQSEWHVVGGSGSWYVSIIENA